MSAQDIKEPAIIYADPGELKPCPFCGSEAAFEHDSDDSIRAQWRVYCLDRTEGCPIGLTNTIGYPRRRQAATDWNHRK